jgi:hypothetical protein
MNGQVEALERDLSRLSELLHKHGHGGKATVVDQILASLHAPTPDYKRLAGIDVWGGSGAVWEVCLTPAGAGKEDERAFGQTIIQTAATMDHLKIGTERSRSIAGLSKNGWIKESSSPADVSTRRKTVDNVWSAAGLQEV